jgi:uncharacterized damage-inducible protein DinB
VERIKPSRDLDERASLVGMLDFQRATMLLKADGLDHSQLDQTLAPSSLTIGSLLKHLALVEDSWITERFAGLPLPEPWASAPFETDEDWDFHSAAADSPGTLRELYRAACARSNAAIESVALDAIAPAPDRAGNPYNLRWVLLHLIEETARHAGHVDFIRESIDGVTGE